MHIVLCDYLGRKDLESKELIREFEKALQVASQTIEKLQTELDRANFITSRFKQDVKAQVLNKILISRQEQLQIKQQKSELSHSAREVERANFFKAQEASYVKLLREHEMRLAHLEKEAKVLEDENCNMKQSLMVLGEQKEEIESTLTMFEQEIENRRASIEKRAELSADDRFKSKNESLKLYFDSHLTKLIL